MTYNASDKETREAMGKVLHIGNLDLSTINNANKLLLDKLKSPAPDIQLEIANSLFGNSSFEFLPDFINNTKNFYNAKVNNFDFGNQELANENAQKINDWISSNTNNKINNVIEPESLSNNTLLYLINAIYFKSNWTNKFNEENTEPRKFFLSDGTTKEIPMMKQFSRFKYLAPNSYQGNNFQGIELPYGKDGKVSMYVFLPSDDSNLDELYKTINSTTGFQFEELIKNFYTEGGVIVLPKFKMSYKII